MEPSVFDDIHAFWFGPIPSFESLNSDRLELWFGGTRDSEIASRFSTVLGEIESTDIEAGALTPSQQIGLVVLLDQFPRSIWRGQPRSYAFDERARAVVKAAITDKGMEPFKLVERAFLTICLAHSETLKDQELACEHYLQDVAPFAPAGNRFYDGGRIQIAKYLDIIKRFGHFPHRNAILGRETTLKETQFLAENEMTPF